MPGSDNPFAWQRNFPSASTFARSGTGLFLVKPVNGGTATGQARQLTFPQSASGISVRGPYVGWQTDFQPAFSPDGKKVAYIHSLNVTISGILGYLSQPAIHIVDIATTNDVEVILFKVSEYVSHLSWAPDGSRLAFDLGPQAIGPAGFPYFVAVASSNALYTINVDGTGMKALRPPGYLACLVTRISHSSGGTTGVHPLRKAR